MEKLPVKLLTELISYDEILVATHVICTHEVSFCPVGVSMPESSRVSLKLHCGDEQVSEFRYTPQTYFAIKVWETARDNLLKNPEFANALDVEWYPVAATFRSIRYVNGSPERFISAMFDEMERLANSHTIDIRYGRFDMPALPVRPDYPRRYYIMPHEILIEKNGRSMKDELKEIQGSPAGKFEWTDIKDAFAILKPIQLAFIAGDEMNNHTPLDDEFLDACGEFNLEKVKELVAKGANIHAASHYGDTAMDTMMSEYGYIEFDDKSEHCSIDNPNHDRFIELAQYLLSIGYNINIAGYAAPTCLDSAPHIEDIGIVKFLLDNGADPNVGSYIGDFGYDLGRAALMHVWEDEVIVHDVEYYTELSMLLLRYGALPIPRGETLNESKLDEWIEAQKKDGLWADSICSDLSKLDSALVNGVRDMNFYYVPLIVKSGGNVGVRDSRGRNLLQIALEDAELNRPESKYFRINIAEMILMLLCGLRLKLSDAEIEQIKMICRKKGYSEALDAIASITTPIGG